MVDTNEKHHAYHAIHGMKEVNTVADYNYLLANGWYDTPIKCSLGSPKKEVKKKVENVEEGKDAVSQ